MIKHFAYMLKSLARLLYRRIIYYDTGVLVLRLNAILAKKTLEADNCLIHETTPIHCLTDHHSIVAVLTSFQQAIEFLLVYGMNRLSVYAEEAELEDKLDGRNAIMFLQRQPVEHVSEAKFSEKW